MKTASPPSGRFRKFAKRYPEIAASYEGLRVEVNAAGPLTNRDRALVKVAVSVGMGKRAGAYAHLRKAVDAGLSREQLEHVALLALPTIGLPSSISALEWIDDVFSKRRRPA
jgi:alkylhydroperoxidase/carboxymuconolactone decarboxylase family protein YurZ